MATTRHTDDSRSSVETDVPTTDEVFDLLGHRYRRVLLACLRQSEWPLHQRTIAIEIARRGDERSREDLTETEIERVETALYHSHVSKLRDHGIVSSVGDSDVLVLEDAVEHLEPHLDLIAEPVDVR